MVTAKIFQGNDTRPYVEATSEGDFQQLKKDLNMWLAGCSNNSLDIIFKDGGLLHLEGDGEVCQWHYTKGEVVQHFNGGETVLVR